MWLVVFEAFKLYTIYHIWECILIRFIISNSIYSIIVFNGDIDNIKINCRYYNNTNIKWKIGITVYYYDWYCVTNNITFIIHIKLYSK